MTGLTGWAANRTGPAMMMVGSSSNGCSTSEDEGAAEVEGGYSTPEGGATDIAEGASCNATRSDVKMHQMVRKHRLVKHNVLGDDQSSRKDVEAP